MLLGWEQGPGTPPRTAPTSPSPRSSSTSLSTAPSRSSSEEGEVVPGSRLALAKPQISPQEPGQPEGLRVAGAGHCPLGPAPAWGFPAGYPRVGSGEGGCSVSSPRQGQPTPGGRGEGALGWPSSASLSSLLCFLLSGTESFGLFSCLVNGEEREQTHRAVFRYRHPSLAPDLHRVSDPLGPWWAQPSPPAPALVISHL